MRLAPGSWVTKVGGEPDRIVPVGLPSHLGITLVLPDGIHLDGYSYLVAEDEATALQSHVPLQTEVLAIGRRLRHHTRRPRVMAPLQS